MYRITPNKNIYIKFDGFEAIFEAVQETNPYIPKEEEEADKNNLEDQDDKKNNDEDDELENEDENNDKNNDNDENDNVDDDNVEDDNEYFIKLEVRYVKSPNSDSDDFDFK